jgi:hypothetical protein
MVRLYEGDAPWFRGFGPIGATFVRGLHVAALGVAFLVPGAAILASAAVDTPMRPVLLVLGAVVTLACFHAFPVAICDYARGDGRDRSWFFGHRRAMRAAAAMGMPFVRMWLICWATIAVSVAPLLAAVIGVEVTDRAAWGLLAIGFFVASPWAWSAIGFGFGSVLVPEVVVYERTRRFA